MALKNIELSIDAKLFDRLKKKAKDLRYSTIEDYITELIRRAVFNKKQVIRFSDKIDVSRILSRKHIFGKKGKPYPI